MPFESDFKRINRTKTAIMNKSKVKSLDAKFEKFLLSIQNDVREDEFQPEKRARRRELADKSDLEFCRIYFPNIFTHEFNGVHKHIANLQIGNHTISGFPQSGKSAFGFVAKGIKPLVMGIGGIINVTLRTIEVSKQRTAHLARMIKKNRLLNYDYDINFLQDSAGYYIINNTVLLASSIETGLRGQVDEDFNRFKISLNDDLYNRISVRSSNDNEKVVDFITGELYRQMEDDGLSITFGNRITEDCPIVQLEKLFPKSHFSFPILDSQGNSNWPQRYPTDVIEKKKVDVPLDIWEGEWMDEPFEVGEIMQKDWLRSININLIDIIASISAVDPSPGESPNACFKGCITGGITNKNEVVVTDTYVRKEPYYDFFDYLDEVKNRTKNFKCILFENDFNQYGFAKPYYEGWVKERHKTLPLILHLSKNSSTEYRAADKESRIMNLVHPHQTGMILYSDLILGSSDYKRLVAQYLSFGKSKKKLDGLDALATLYIKIFQYVTDNSFNSLRKRIFTKRRLFR